MRALGAALGVVFWLGGAAAATPAPTSTPEELYRRGNQAYRQARYAEAADFYHRAVAAGAGGADVWYNLGTTLFRLGKYGRAALALERALARSPRNADAVANLAVVHRRLRLNQAKQELGIGNEGFWQRSARRVTSGEAGAVFLVFYLLLFAGLIARRWMRPGTKRSLVGLAALGLLVLTLVTGGFFAFKVYQDERVTEGVILAPKVALMQPHKGSWKSVRRLPQGLRVRILAEREGWWQVRLPGGLSGYVRKKQLEKI